MLDKLLSNVTGFVGQLGGVLGGAGGGGGIGGFLKGLLKVGAGLLNSPLGKALTVAFPPLKAAAVAVGVLSLIPGLSDSVGGGAKY